MKYKVIGWTDYGNGEYPENPDPCGHSAWKALVEELRAKGYRFGGDSHQYCSGCVPVLNDGTRLEYSMRTWGRAVAEAVYGDNPPPGSYMDFYMDCVAQIPEGEKPDMPRSYVDKSLIAPAESIADTYGMKLVPAAFAAIKSGKKTVEARLYDAKRQLLDVGDFIIFTDIATGESIKTRIEWLIYADDFNELARCCGPARLGCGRGVTCKRFAKSMEQYYSPEDISKYGVLGIVIKIVK